VADAGLLPGPEGDSIETRRAELAALRLGALEALAEAGTRLGGTDLAAAEAAARAAVEAVPFRESARVALMGGPARAGQCGAATCATRRR
jgi:hypothetical protein